jgi:enoyl-CoA hydratase/3-hydroxyacyl-CoA dehydrogenase
VVASEEVQDRALELAADLAAGPPVAQRFVKRAIHRGREDMDAGLELEAQAFGHLVGTDDLQTGLAAYKRDEEPEFHGR